MSQSSLPPELRQLPIPERIVLVEQIWDSIVDDNESIHLSDAHKAELDRRLAERSELRKRGASFENPNEL